MVEGAASKPSARQIAMSIANSPLVKTAIAGEDANWGRVVMAVGKAGEPADRDKLSIWFNGIRVAQGRARSGLRRAEVSAAMKSRDLAESRLGLGTRPRPRADLRPHQGICRDQRRLPLLSAIRLSADEAGMNASMGRHQAYPRCRLRADRRRRPRAARAAARRASRWPGLWEFPGGKVERRAAAGATLIRELHEEIGITVSEPCLAPLTFASHAYDSFHLLMPLYICRRWEGEVIAREGQQLPGSAPTGCATIRCRRRTSR